MVFDTLYLVNQMMLEIGEKTIGSLGTSSKSQRLATQTIDGIIDDVFSLRIDYKFATARAELTALADAPVFGYDFQYKLPDGCVRVLAMVDENGDEIQYKWRREVYISGSEQTDVILTNLSECRIKYIVLRTNPARWEAWFRRLVILTGASRMCVPLSKDDYRKLSIKKDLEQAIKDAKAANNAEDADVDEMGRNFDQGNDEVVEGILGPTQKREDYRGW